MAVDVIFPPILYPNFGFFLTYERYGNCYHYEKQKIIENLKHFVMITQKNSNDIIIGHNIFKCKGNVYISNIYVCDGKEDCPDSSKLDEVGCYCYHTDNYSSKCKYITTNNYDNLVQHCSPFYYRTVQGDCKMYHLQYTFKNVKQNFKAIFSCHDDETLKSSTFLKINHNEIENVCNGVHYKETIIIHAAYNSISTVLSNCFVLSKKLKVINLNTNKITTIQAKTFSDLPSLILLNLANNFLMEIHSSVIVNINSLFILSLANNSLKYLSYDSFTDMSLKVILTNDYRVCCILTKNTKCPAKPPWYKSCSNLLPDIYIKITFYCLSLLIITGNITSLLYLKFLKMNTAFDIIVRFVNFSDLLCGIYIFILWIADIYFRGEFALQETNWISHPICFVAFGMSLHFSLFSPCILLFMSLSQMLIVIYPLDPQFKDITLL